MRGMLVCDKFLSHEFMWSSLEMVKCVHKFILGTTYHYSYTLRCDVRAFFSGYDSWASGHWHYERTLYSRRPLKRDWSFYLYGYDSKIMTTFKLNVEDTRVGRVFRMNTTCHLDNVM